ncbi:MAG: AMIN domain-containing protein [Helicobacteraceae bacterium]|nr:AMIN domain-containing protein [Helicobacteraceae bacterium]
MKIATLAALCVLLVACARPHMGLSESKDAAKSPDETALTQTLIDYYVAARSEETSAETLSDLTANLKRLIEGKKADVNKPSEQGVLPLSIAAQANDRVMIERLCKAGANYDAFGAHRLPLLTLSLQEGALESAKALLSCGANPNVGVPSPLTIAVLGGITSPDYRQMAIALLNSGADPNLGGVGEHALLLYAIKTKQSNLAQKMIEKGANIELADDEGMTPLVWAILLKDEDTTNALLAKGAATNAIDASGYTPLDWAVFADNQIALSAIVSDPNWSAKENERGVLAAQIAKTRALTELKSLILDEKPVQNDAKKRPSIARFKGMEFLTIEYGWDRIAFKTDDPLLRDFALENPARLVLDFSRANAVQSLTLPLDPNGTFRKVSIGRHTGSYRVVVVLDRSYGYDLKRTADGPVVTLR